MGRFETMCDSYLAEEKLVGRSVGGHFIYLNPTKEEVERITYEVPNDQKGFRAFYMHPYEGRPARIYAFTNNLVHMIVEEYLEESGLAEHAELRTAVMVEYYQFLGKIPEWGEGRERGVILQDTIRGPKYDPKEILRMLHLPEDLYVEIA